MAEFVEMIRPTGEAEIFFGKSEKRLDTPGNTPVNKPPDGQITATAERAPLRAFLPPAPTCRARQIARRLEGPILTSEVIAGMIES
jgi:hypothetical protein